jgi:hypothetical protein
MLVRHPSASEGLELRSEVSESGIIAQTCNITYAGGRDGKITIEGQHEKKLARSHVKKHAGCDSAHLSFQLGEKQRLEDHS